MNYLLIAMVLLPIVGALGILLLPSHKSVSSRVIAGIVSTAVACIALVLWSEFSGAAAQLQFETKIPWLAFLGVSFHLGLDGLNLPLVAMTALLTPLIFLGTWNQLGDRSMQKAVTSMILLMEAGALGTFLSQDLVLFYVFWELILVPAYLLIGMYGHADRYKATVQFFLYTFAGSLLMLLSIGWLVWIQKASTGVPSAAFADLQNLLLDFDASKPLAGLLSGQGLIFLGFGAAFFIKAPLLGLHGWLAAAYKQAPTVVTVYLAAILSKMGTYGILKLMIPLTPDAMQAFSGPLMWLAAAGIVYGAVLAIAQTDLKLVVAYSSLSHVSYILLGLFSLTPSAMSGALMQMVNHAVTIAGLFLVVGHIERRHPNPKLGDCAGLAKDLPLLSIAFVIFALSSVALPGTGSFVGELMILVGSFKSFPGPILLASCGMVLGAVYMLRMIQLSVFGTRNDNEKSLRPNPLVLKESFVLIALCFAIFGMGLLPQFILGPSQATFEFNYKQQAATGMSASEPSF